MHTSKVLNATDFQYWSLPAQSQVAVEFSTFCPQYHTLDRVGIVSPTFEEGLRYTAYALLALATAFYDVLRAQSADFYDYPHHFAFLAVHPTGVRTRAGYLLLDHAAMGAPWGGLDVWPDSNWIAAPDSAAGMLKKVFDWQISRLFWPENIRAEEEGLRLPGHVRALLRTRLKTVYYYHTTAPTVAIQATQQVEDMVQRSLARLPNQTAAGQAALPSTCGPLAAADRFPYYEQYRQVSVQEFLSAMDACFDTAP